MDRIIFHIDVNSAFLSWQATYDKSTGTRDFDLRKVASVVGGDEESRHGVVLAKSDIAKKHGIKTGQPIFTARKLCPGLITVPPNFKIYKKYSNMLYDLLCDYSDVIERYSIDECFLDFSASKKLFGDPVKTAFTIRNRIKDELGFTVNVGISTNKFLAKMAGELKKPNQVITLFPEEMEKKLFPLPIDEMFMVGKKTKEKLNRLGIKYIGDLNKCSLEFLVKHFKKAQGTQLYNYSHGIDNSKLETNRETKSIGNSITLREDLTDINEINKVLLTLSDSVGTRLRKKNLKGKVITVTIKNSSFLSYSHQLTIMNGTDSTDEIYKKAAFLFSEFWRNDPVRLLGVSVGKLDTETTEQLSLLNNNKENKKMDKVEKVMDQLRSNYGQNIIKRGMKNNIHDHISDKIDYYK